MSRLIKVLDKCSQSDGSYDWITHYVSTSDGVYEKTYWTFGDLLNDLTDKRGHYGDEELGVLNIQIDGPDDTFACQTIEVLNYFRSKTNTPDEEKEGVGLLGKVAVATALAGLGPVGWMGLAGWAGWKACASDQQNAEGAK